MKKHFVALLDYIKHLRTTWSIIPSSKFLVDKTISKIDHTWNEKILLLWFWNWIVLKRLLIKKWKDINLTIFEISPDYKKFYDKIVEDYNWLENVTYIEDSAENISKYNLWQFDYIISTLPFSIINKNTKQKILEEIKNSLKKWWKFLQYQYSLYNKKDFEKIFNKKAKISFVPLNIPPAFVYEIQN